MRYPAGLCLVFLVACGGEKPIPTGPWQAVDADRAAVYARELEEARAEQDLPGLAMALAFRDTRELWVGATGASRLEPRTEWLPGDESRIGSVTKTFTTAAIFQLVEEGTLSLEDPIEQWVPGYFQGPTLRHLLGHSSGIVSYNYVGGFDTSRPWTPTELLQWAVGHEPDLRFAPGSQWEYSNTNYVLLGLTIEAATGKSYGAVLGERFFGPLGLEDTRLAASGDQSERLVHAYAGSPPVENGDTADPSFGWAAGGVVSTPDDLARWTVALFGGDEVLTRSSRELMFTPGGLTGEGESLYGLGAFYESDGEHTLYGHTGGIAGYTSFAFYLEDPAVALVILSNWQETDLRAAASYGWAAVLEIDYP